MKKIFSIISIFILGVTLVSCGAGKPDESSITFDQAKVKEESKIIVDEINKGQFKEIVDKGTEQIKGQLTDEKLKELWDSLKPKLGEFKSIADISLVEDNGYCIATVVAEYEKNKVTFTITFDKDYKLAGFFIK